MSCGEIHCGPACPMCWPDLFEAFAKHPPAIKLCSRHENHPLARFFNHSPQHAEEPHELRFEPHLKRWTHLLAAVLELEEAVDACWEHERRQFDKAAGLATKPRTARKVAKVKRGFIKAPTIAEVQREIDADKRRRDELH